MLSLYKSLKLYIYRWVYLHGELFACDKRYCYWAIMLRGAHKCLSFPCIQISLTFYLLDMYMLSYAAGFSAFLINQPVYYLQIYIVQYIMPTNWYYFHVLWAHICWIFNMSSFALLKLRRHMVVSFLYCLACVLHLNLAELQFLLYSQVSSTLFKLCSCCEFWHGLP